MFTRKTAHQFEDLFKESYITPQPQRDVDAEDSPDPVVIDNNENDQQQSDHEWVQLTLPDTDEYPQYVHPDQVQTP